MKNQFFLLYNVLGKCLSVMIWLFFYFTVTTGAAKAAPVNGVCNLPKSDYQTEGYKVRQVKIEGISVFLNILNGRADSLKLRLPLKQNDLFTVDKFNKGREQIQNHLNSNQSVDQTVQVNVILPRIENCSDPENSQSGFLDVVYKVFTTNYNAYLSHTWEIKKKQIEEEGAAVDTVLAPSSSSRLLTVNPFFAYNRTRHLYGGVELALKVPDKEINVFKIAASGSQNSSLVEAELGGDVSPLKSAANYIEYRLSYKYSNLPAANNRLREGTVQFQLNAATKPLGDRRVVFRYGAALEGGNRQSDLITEANNQGSIPNTGYGALKGYAGATFSTNTLAFTGSYGLQLGTNGRSAKIQFSKHIADLAVTKRWIPENQTPGEVHKILTFDARLAGGVIQTFGQVPVGERFFGGNTPQTFITNNNWEILSNPYIRSISQNRLNSGTTIGAVGGNKFYSLNLTAARLIWGRPILFKELYDEEGLSPTDLEKHRRVQAQELVSMLDAATKSAKSILKNYYAVKLNLYEPIVAAMLEENQNSGNVSLKTELNNLLKILDKLPDELPGEETLEVEEENEEESESGYSDQKTALRDYVFLLMKRSVATKEKAAERLLAIIRDADPEGCTDDIAQCGGITTIVKRSRHLHDTLRRYAEGIAESSEKQNLLKAATDIQASYGSLISQQTALNNLLEKLSSDGKLKPAEDLAEADMRDVVKVKSTITDELNLYALSPVGMFDVARLYPDKYGTRFGAGAGLRLSIANFNATFGYVFNLNPKPDEGRGAFTFSVDIVDLFR